MRALVVVEVDPGGDGGLCLLEGLEVVEPDALLLECAEEPLDHPILLRAVGRREFLLEAVLLAPRHEPP